MVNQVQVMGKSSKVYEVGLIAPKYEVGRTKQGIPINVPVYDWSIRHYIRDAIQHKISRKWDAIVMVTGERRVGKTALAGQLARCIDPAFPVSNITFEIEDFNRVLSANPYADPSAGIWPQVVLDEAGYDLFSQNWMERVQRNIVRKLEVIGAKRQVVWFVLPHRKKLNKSIREEMPRFWLNVATFEEERGFAVLRECVQNEWEEEVFWKPIAAFCYQDYVVDDFWKAYLAKKAAFIDKVAAEDPGEEPTGRFKVALSQRDAAIKLLYRQGGWSHARLAREVGMKPNTVSDILRGVDKGPVLA